MEIQSQDVIDRYKVMYSDLYHQKLVLDIAKDKLMEENKILKLKIQNLENNNGEQKK